MLCYLDLGSNPNISTSVKLLAKYLTKKRQPGDVRLLDSNRREFVVSNRREFVVRNDKSLTKSLALAAIAESERAEMVEAPMAMAA
jgi:hypothetical protein